MSAPAKEMPTSPGCRTALTCHLRSCHVDAESPVQCAVYAPEPTNEDLQEPMHSNPSQSSQGQVLAAVMLLGKLF